MAWLEYQRSNGYVVAIHDVEPANVPEEHNIISTNEFKAGDEFEYYISVVLDETGNPTGQFAAIRQAPPASYIMRRLNEKDSQIAELQQIVADLASLLIDKGVI